MVPSGHSLLVFTLLYDSFSLEDRLNLVRLASDEQDMPKMRVCPWKAGLQKTSCWHSSSLADLSFVR